MCTSGVVNLQMMRERLKSFTSGLARRLAGWNGMELFPFIRVYESKWTTILFFSWQRQKKTDFPTNVKILARFIGPRWSLLFPIVCSHNLFSAVRTVPLCPQETSCTRPSIIFPIWKRQVSRSQPQIIMMFFSQQEERLQMGQKPPTQVVSGLLKAEKAGAISQWMTKEPNNIQ